MKPFESNIFTKIMVIIVLLLIPILLLYGYSNKVSVRVVQNEINTSYDNQMTFFLSQVDAHVEQLAKNTVTLSRDPTVREYSYLHLLTDWYDSNQTQITILDKLFLQSVSDNWSPQYVLYNPNSQRFLTTESSGSFDDTKMQNVREGWQYRVRQADGVSLMEDRREFVWYGVSPVNAYSNPSQADLIIESAFAEINMVKMLDRYKSGGKGDPFFYDPQHGTIESRSANEAVIGKLTRQLEGTDLGTFRSATMDLGGREYLVKVMQSKMLGWYLVDYVPIDAITDPIISSRNLFYASTALLLVMSLLAAFLLYRHVRVPLRELMIHVQKIKRGDFSSRIVYKPKNEFVFLIQRFNEMSDQMQQLIETVFEEKIRSRDARLKQLQSQINPHFLYNCLFFIKNMVRIGDEEAVVRMSMSLAEYYRYSTRLDIPDVRLEEEVALVNNYLTIQQLRMKRIRFEIDIPANMSGLTMPRLLLQPVVENALIHGIEMQEDGGWIGIRGESDEEEYRIIVEDNGTGLDEEQMRSIRDKIGVPMDETTGFGLWNVHQRLGFRFGEGAGLRLSNSDKGGLKVELVWKREKGFE
ncbi:sensor histidine kinase [Paenibacillus sp. CF384]|uniref:sensor histidine kinase n=1 Tax=Paenibacillus sp. CF384 TaxID=1884382 RepID=UPI00089823FB|nr:sensor histidine kinase [Paenibacillus sp. CF384]SDX93188.1 two-component system, sensor histidine kinase YesM [Paenibacillus sp. CF384]